MSNRRNFLKHAGAFALGSFLLPACNTAGNKTQTGNEVTGAATDSAATAGAGTGNLGPIGIQLWSVKDVVEKDLKGTLQTLGEIGYKEIESYPGEKGHYYGMQPQEFKKMLNDFGLELVSSHVGSGVRGGNVNGWQQATLLQNYEELVSKATETGQKYITCSWMDESLRKTPDDLKRTAELFNKCGEIAQKAGLQFAYHNHAFEFEKVGDQVLYDYMLENTDKDLVQYELDLYWVVNGGQDPIAYLQKYPNRFPLGHVKDMDKADRTKNTEIGSGSIDYKKILSVAQDSGMKHYFVEQESFTRPSIESMKMNYKYLSDLTV